MVVVVLSSTFLGVGLHICVYTPFNVIRNRTRPGFNRCKINTVFRLHQLPPPEKSDDFTDVGVNNAHLTCTRYE